MDKNMEHEMETGVIHGVVGMSLCWRLAFPVVETAVCHVCSRNVTLVAFFQIPE